jgi:pimeloyl-ACP methyl ester carboxylesterase
MSRKRIIRFRAAPGHAYGRFSTCAGWLLGLGLLAGPHCLDPGPGFHRAAAADSAVAEPAAAEAEKAEPAAAPAQSQLPAAAEVELETSDGVALSVWHYPGNATNTEGGGVSVILLHDFGGSHKEVEPLATALQSIGCDVVVPDLRGHGASRIRRVGGQECKVEAKALKAPEVEFMAHSRGSQVRDQAAQRGDVETTRNWMISQQLPMDRLHVAGVGLGAALAAAWTAEDAAWPSLASGPQGKQVRGLVMIAPLLAPRGLSLLKPLEQETVRRTTPILILGGRSDKDADRAFDQLKRQRPQAWFKRPAKGKVERAEKLEDASKATLFQIELDSGAEGEKLAAEPGVAEAIERFLSLTKPAQKPRR